MSKTKSRSKQYALEKSSQQNVERRRIWLMRFQQLKKFKEETGHCRVPQIYEPNPALGNWVKYQRDKYNNHKSWLDIREIECLNSISFDWNVKKSWSMHYNMLVLFREKHGHCNVPRETPSLGWWVHEQHKNINMFKKNKQKSKLTQKQFNSLLVLDFLGTMQKCENKNVHCKLFSVENQYVHENTDSDAIDDSVNCNMIGEEGEELICSNDKVEEVDKKKEDELMCQDSSDFEVTMEDNFFQNTGECCDSIDNKDPKVHTCDSNDSTFNQIGRELCAQIMFYLHARELHNLSQTSKTWSNDDLWKVFFCTRFEGIQLPTSESLWRGYFFRRTHDESVSILTKAQKVLKSERRSSRLASIMKLVQKGEKSFGFNSNFHEIVNISFQSIDFLPGTTLFAKKSLLNMAIVHQRRDVVEWLVDKMKVDVNSCGDGEFSPLIYAAYGGNLKLVEYLLSRGADECKIGFFGIFDNTTQIFASQMQLDAEEWALKKEHHQVATAIKFSKQGKQLKQFQKENEESKCEVAELKSKMAIILNKLGS